MLSRVAESIYWMSRYIERAENVARFVSVNLNLSLDMPGEAGEQWAPLVVTTGDEEIYQARYGLYTQDNVIRFLTLDADNPNSIISPQSEHSAVIIFTSSTSELPGLNLKNQVPLRNNSYPRLGYRTNPI